MAVGSSLPSSYNYVRNSVKVIIDAYSGQMTFYDADPNDPILQAYSAAFPHMFIPLSKMSPQLQAHLRYPEDIFSAQSAIYGRYHLVNPQNFYAASNAWQLSPTAGAGPQSQALLAQNTYNNQGQLISTTPARMAPQYQVYALPSANQSTASQQVFTISDGFVPASQSTVSGSNQNFNLTAWMVGLSDPGHRGQLNLYETPQGTTGPANADAEISGDPTVSSQISLLDQHGSEVLLGETLMVPIADSMVYLRPMYVSPTTNPQPQLVDVIAVLGKKVRIDTSLSAVLGDLLQTTVSLPSGNGVPSTGTVPAAVTGYLGPGPDGLQQRGHRTACGRTWPRSSPTFRPWRSRSPKPSRCSGRRPGAPRPRRPPPRRRRSRPRRRSRLKTTGSGTTTSSTASTVPTSTEPKGTTTSSTLASAAARH